MKTNIHKATGSILRAFYLAAECSTKSNMLSKHGSVCMKGRKIVTTGYNSNRMYHKGMICSSLHAEVSAISRLSNKYLQRKKGTREENKYSSNKNK